MRAKQAQKRDSLNSRVDMPLSIRSSLIYSGGRHAAVASFQPSLFVLSHLLLPFGGILLADGKLRWCLCLLDPGNLESRIYEFPAHSPVRCFGCACVTLRAPHVVETKVVHGNVRVHVEHLVELPSLEEEDGVEVLGFDLPPLPLGVRYLAGHYPGQLLLVPL